MSIITLLTDFGPTDSYVAEMKAVVLRTAPSATLVDITHDLALGDVAAARYLLSRTWPQFPPGTVHLVVVDPGVGSSRRAIAIERDGQFAVGPDNGVLSPVLEHAVVVELEVPEGAAPTFHGRDVFAPAAARLALGDTLAALGTAVADPVYRPWPTPRFEAGVWVGEVLFVDHFGTLITNIPATDVSPSARVEVSGIEVGSVRRTFSDVESRRVLALVGSGGMVEIAVRDGSAAKRLNQEIGSTVRVWER